MKMKVENVMVFSVDSGESKNGFYCNISLLDMVDREQLKLFTKDVEIAKAFSDVMELNINVDVVVRYMQNEKFGNRITDILEINPVKENKTRTSNKTDKVS